MAMNLAGSVYNELGGPVNGASVAVKNEAGTVVASTSTGPTGAWSVAGLLATSAHTVEISLAGSQVRKIWGDIRVQVGEIVVIDKFELASGGSLVVPAGIITDTEIGPRTADQALPTPGNTGSLTQLLSWIVGRIKAITGGTNWYDAPAISLASTKGHVDATQAHGVTGALVGTAGAQTLSGKTLASPVITDFTSAQHDHTSAAQGGNTSLQMATGTVGVGGCTTTQITIPSSSRLVSLAINGLTKSTGSRVDATTVSYGETRLAGDQVVVFYVAS